MSPGTPGTDKAGDKVDDKGTTAETVFVRQLPIRLFPQLRAALQDEGKMIELYCDKPAGWADGLTVESHEELIAKGDEINRDFFSRWVERMKSREGLVPKVDAAEIAQIVEAVGRSNPELLASVMGAGKQQPLPPGSRRSAPSAG